MSPRKKQVEAFALPTPTPAPVEIPVPDFVGEMSDMLRDDWMGGTICISRSKLSHVQSGFTTGGEGYLMSLPASEGLSQ
jgi:hypothetical protein